MRNSLRRRFLTFATIAILLLFCACQGNTGGGKSVGKMSSDGKLQVIPTVKSLEWTAKNGKYEFFRYEPTISCQVESWQKASDVFCEYADLLHEVSWTKADKATLRLVQDDSMVGGAYKISCSNYVTLSAADEAGVQAGFATLLQIMEPKEGDILLPHVTIQDQADASYRGLMIDLARNWHEMDLIYRYVDLCYFYKINMLHLHFTDAESYTLPSSVYPNLSTEGRHYTREQIDALVEYAHNRGVTLIPEIETPGHSQTFAAAYPKLFGTKGILCSHDEVFDALDAVLQEVTEMFPYSPYIHIGGDEAAINNWLQCSKCMQYAKQNNLFVQGDTSLTVQKLYANFVQKVADIVKKYGRQPIVWEGFAKEVNDLVSKDVIVISWENHYQSTQDLVAAGFPIINCAWQPMYIVPPDTGWSDEEILDWSIYFWNHWWDQSSALGGFEIEPTDQVIGGQISVWGNPSNGVNQEFNMVMQRVPALAEKTWNVNSTRDIEEFRTSYRSTRSIFQPIYQKAVADQGRVLVNRFGSGADQSGVSQLATSNSTSLASCFEVWEGTFSGLSMEISVQKPGKVSVYQWKKDYASTIAGKVLYTEEIKEKAGWEQGSAYEIIFPTPLEAGTYLVVFEGGEIRFWAHNVYGGVQTFQNGKDYTTGTLKLRSFVN